MHGPGSTITFIRLYSLFVTALSKKSIEKMNKCPIINSLQVYQYPKYLRFSEMAS